MKNLLNAVRSRLQSQVTYLKKVVVVIDDDDVPEGALPPFVTLVDRGMVTTEGKYEHDEALTVRILAYQEVFQQEASVMGTTTQKGVEDIVADVKVALRNWFPDAYHNSDVRAESGTRLVVAVGRDESGRPEFAARKTVDYVYERNIVGE